MSWPERARVRAVLAVARDRAVDEARVLLAQPLVAHAEPVHHAGPERLEQHVVLAHQPQQHLAAALLLEVQPDRALAAVEREEQRRLRRVVGALVVGRRPADVVAHAGVLDLEHVGAEVGEQQRAEAARQQPGEVEDLDVRERAHAVDPSRACRAARAPRRRSPRAGRRPRPSAAPARSGRRSSAPSRRRAGRSCPRGPTRTLPPSAAAAATSIHWSRLIPITPQLLRPSAPPGICSAMWARLRGVGPDAAGHAHHARDLQRLGQQPHVEQRVEVGHVPGVEALVLGPDAELVHRRRGTR